MKNKLGRVELFYKNLFKKNIEKCSVEHTAFLDTLPLPILNENEKQLYERALTETELNVAIMSMAPKTSNSYRKKIEIKDLLKTGVRFLSKTLITK